MKHPPHLYSVNVEDAAAQRHIGLLLFDGVQELDAAGPWEVLASWTRHHPQYGWSNSCLSADGADVTGGAKNLVPGAHHSLVDAPALDVLIHRAAMASAGCSTMPTTSTGCAPNARLSRLTL